MRIVADVSLSLEREINTFDSDMFVTGREAQHSFIQFFKIVMLLVSS